MDFFYCKHDEKCHFVQLDMHFFVGMQFFLLIRRKNFQKAPRYDILKMSLKV